MMKRKIVDPKLKFVDEKKAHKCEYSLETFIYFLIWALITLNYDLTGRSSALLLLFIVAITISILYKRNNLPWVIVYTLIMTTFFSVIYYVPPNPLHP